MGKYTQFNRIQRLMFARVCFLENFCKNNANKFSSGQQPEPQWTHSGLTVDSQLNSLTVCRNNRNAPSLA